MDFAYVLMLGFVTSLPVACASWGALSPGSALTRYRNTFIPGLAIPGSLVVLFRGAGLALLLLAGCLFAYLMSLTIYSILRRFGWRFVTAADTAGKEPDSRIRFSTIKLLAASGATTVFIGVGANLHAIEPGTIRFFISYALLFCAGSLLPHIAMKLLDKRSFAAAFLCFLMIVLGSLFAVDQGVTGGMPSGPFGFKRDTLSFFGPITIGYTLAGLGLQALYLSIVYGNGYRLRLSRSEPDC